jgi:hypothetical protein
VLPPASQTYANVMMSESDHISCFFPREVLPNLNHPFCNLSLDFHESTIPIFESNPDSKLTKFSS